jgi:hypothetical protein
MLAEEGGFNIQSGSLTVGIHRPAAWLLSLIHFVGDQLPLWRDRSDRQSVSSEVRLTAQLCAHLNSAARKSAGWDILQFRREEPDEGQPGRSIDLAPAPSGETIWINGRRYSDFDPLLPIECKRLPTPTGSGRDKREYLRTAQGTTGGVQRFKAGHHGSIHRVGAMIGYVQAENISLWVRRINVWIRALARAGIAGWTPDDCLMLHHHNANSRMAMLTSEHRRERGLPNIALHHLWVEVP